MFKQYFGAEADLAYAVAKAESGVVSKAGAVNMDGSQDWGVMQINDRWHCPKVGAEAFSEDCHNKLLDVETNVRVAKQIRDDSGWGAWSVINNGRYLNFM